MSDVKVLQRQASCAHEFVGAYTNKCVHCNLSLLEWRETGKAGAELRLALATVEARLAEAERALTGIASCSTCEMCRSAAIAALTGATTEPVFGVVTTSQPKAE